MVKLNKSLFYLVVLISLVLIQSLEAKESGPKNGSAAPEQFLRGQPQFHLLNINELSVWIQWNGVSARNPYTGDSGILYPRGLVSAVFSDGLIWGGIVQDPNPPQLRVGGQTYISGMAPGRILPNGDPDNPALPHVRVYKIRPDYQTLPNSVVKTEAAEFFNIDEVSVTQAQMDSILAWYGRDWNEWPVDQGAPFYDLNGNGIYEPGLGEEPGLADADQVLWLVLNDLDPSATNNFSGSPPAGLEVQTTIWGYNQTGTALDQAAIRRYRVINKSAFAIDSMYLAQWADPDLGDFGDDVVGCDSLLDLGFVYNGFPVDTDYALHGLNPPSVGYTLLQGPIVPSPGDTAVFNFQRRAGFKNLAMSSFSYFVGGDPVLIDPPIGNYDGTLGWYNLLRGFIPTFDVTNPTPYTHGSGPLTGRATKFPLNGDPESDPTGLVSDIDAQGNNLAPSDRRLVVSSGPFYFAPGDTQEIIIAIAGAFGTDYLNSVTQMKSSVQFLRSMSSLITGIQSLKNNNTPGGFSLGQNYPNPFNPSTTIRYDLPSAEFVTLKVYDILGRKAATLVNMRQPAGRYRVHFDAGQFASGIYLYKITAGSLSRVRKMILLK